MILAPSGAAALELWPRHQHEIDLLLTDLVMPLGINGRELAARLLALRTSLKIIYTTGYSAEAAESRTFFPEGENCLQKLFPPSALLAMVRKSLDG